MDVGLDRVPALSTAASTAVLPGHAIHGMRKMHLSITNYEPHRDDRRSAAPELRQQMDDVLKELREARQDIERLRQEVTDLRSMTLLGRWQRFTSHRLTATPHYPPRPI